MTQSQIHEVTLQQYMNLLSKFFLENGIAWEGADGDKNSFEFGDYILNKWKQPITELTLKTAFEKLRAANRLVIKSSAQAEYDRRVVAEPERAAQLQQLYPKHLIGKDQPDEYYSNLTLLLTELRGRDINPTTITQAEGRIGYRAGKQLVYTKTPRTANPYSHVANDDGTAFVSHGLTKQRDGSLGKSPLEYKREQLARSAANEPQQPENRATIQARAKYQAEMVRGDNHPQDIQIQRLFVTVGGEIDWVATLQARKDLQSRLIQNRSIR